MSGGQERLRIIVLGYIVCGPLGGLAWHHLQYVLGLFRLGHDVYFLEDSQDYPCCYDPVRNETGKDPAYGLKFADAAFRRLGLGERWGYHDAHTARWLGPCGEHMPALCRSADLVLNLLGVRSPPRPWLEPIPARVLVDTDPVFSQIWHLSDPADHARAAAHTAFFSFGENIRAEGCSVPDDGFPWRPTRQPVVPEVWPVTPGPAAGCYTSVMQWDSYPAQEYDGRFFGMKSKSFAPFMDMPSRAPGPFELAVGSKAAPREALKAAGWHVVDPRPPTRTPWTYQDYIRRSKAEFGVAKHGYVVTRSGWFSERSASYLASGRPVVVQETGFTDWLPTGEGVLAFATPEEAVAAIEAVDAHYARHCRAAREVAEAYFDYRKVLPALLENAVNQ